MATSNKFSCFIVWEGTLPIRCAQILLEREHTIYGMISSDGAVHGWARERGIPLTDPKDEDIVTFLSQYPFDCLFSIVNARILPRRVLELPRRGAINYHDAPLPRYAGSYATSRAILQGERVHGVTWHAMTELVDGGDILKQSLVKIADDETAFTLNVKCYDAAVSSFTELIDDLAPDRVSARQQDLSERTFFSRPRRPSPGCLLSWKRSAREIDAFVRALDFGPYPNPLGLPKLAIGMDFLIVSEIEALNSKSVVPPGTITRIDPGFVRVATGDGEIALRKLLTIDGQPLPLADVVAKFGLYEGYQFEELDQEVAARITAYQASISQHEAFWTQQLATLESITLPYVQRKTPHTQTAQGSYMSMPAAGEILKALAHRCATWCRADVLLAAFAAYLARIAGVWSFGFGYRDSELASEVADLEGMFAASVPVHIRIEDQQSFEEVLQAVQEQVKLAKRRKTYARDLIARSPVLRAQASGQGAQFPSICVERVEALLDYQVPHSSELTLVIGEDGRECLWVYNPQALDEQSVVQMQQWFTAFLHGIVSNPQQRIANLPLLTEAEQYRQLVEWNATQASYPKDQCIHRLFEAQVERTPEAVAVVFEDEQLTYRELNQRANQLAHHLQKLGVEPEVLVGLCIERSLEMVIALLGILKAGGAYVPLDPAYPKERLAFILTDAQVPVLVTQQPLADGLPELEARAIYMDADWHAIAQESETNPVSVVKGEHLAYVTYTSGSTGKPKGVAVEHKHLSNYTYGILERLDLAPGFSFAMVQPLTVDSCITTIFPPLCTGGCLHVISRERSVDARALEDYFWRHPIDCLKIAPSHLTALHASSRTEKIMPLKRLIIGGEASSWEWVSGLHALAPNCTIFNHYGPTETTVGVLTYRLEKGQDEHSYSKTPIGRPLANTQVYVLDSYLQPVPIGIPGELYIGGASVARGYLNRPELTVEKFIPDPFSTEPSRRLYKTGDLVHYLPDGNVEFLGRIDDQVKIRGFRIEPGEIEAVLGQHPAVWQVVVVAREDSPDDRRLVAYVVLQRGQIATVGDLQSHLMKHLPSYMLPSAFVLLEELPMTPHGKVDRRALPAPESNRSLAGDVFIAPQSLVHQQLAQIWEDLLDVRPIGIRDNFFDLGGHSLLAARLIARIEQVCGKRLPLSTLFAGPTIENLANALQGKADSDSQGRAPLIAVQAGGSKRPFFFLHGDWTGGAFFCLRLARESGPDQPFYVLEPYKFDALQVPPTFEEMAAAHLESLRAVQPQGPYLLGGYCNGGLVAYEMARQLQAQGQTIALLVLINPDTPARRRWVRSIISRIGKLMRLGQDKQLDWFLRVRHTYGYMRLSHYRRLKAAERLGTVHRDDEPAHIRTEVDSAIPQLAALVPPVGSLRQEWTGIYKWVAKGYLHDLYPGKITFFWTSEETLLRRAVWRKVVEAKGGEAEVHVIPGTHHITARTESLSNLAEDLSMCLSKAQATALT